MSMPCNSDYMSPTPNEISRVSGVHESWKNLLDEVVHTDDVLREKMLLVKAGGVVQYDDRVSRDFQHEVDSLLSGTENAYALQYHRGSQVAHGEMEKLHKRVFKEHDLVVKSYKALLKGNSLSDGIWERLETDQIIHRQGDMMRVWQHYGSMLRKNHEMIRKLAGVDLTQPLIPQLGFDPDDV